MRNDARRVGYDGAMEDNDRNEESTPIPPPPAETAPSATGVVIGDEDELREAPPAENAGEG